MRNWLRALLVASIASAGCGSLREPEPMSVERSAAVDRDVRGFMQTVAHDVTQEGPAAWGKFFSASPSFFMASDGRLAFPNGAAVTAAIPALVRAIKQIELQWGGDLRVDPLAPDLADVGTSWHELRVDAAGSRADERGFFSGTVDRRSGHWQFRNAHWSVAPPAAPAH